MPIFHRRQLQLMFDEAGPWFTRTDASELLNRLDHKTDPDQAIPAEYELGLSWAITRVADTELQPKFGRKTPDIATTNLFPGQPAAIEVTAISDDSLSGESSMNRTANIIGRFADRVRRNASAHLYFSFLETSGHRSVKLQMPLGPFTHKSQFFRKRLTSPNFELTAQHEARLRKWLEIWPPPKPLRIDGEGTAVLVSWKEWVHPMMRTFSSMPSEVYSLTNNVLYERLKDKERKQLSAVPDGYLKCIFLGDAGCRLLRQPEDSDPTRRRISGRDIIGHFVRNSSVDIVCIFSPQKPHGDLLSYRSEPRQWRLYYADKANRPEGFYDKLFEALELLPAPYLDGYQARSWMQQGMLAPQGRGHYLPLSYSSSTARISARALLELLAGRMSASDFRDWITGQDNQFERYLSRGCSISDIQFESKGVDSDDDYVVVRFAADPNASPLRLPHDLLDKKLETKG